MKARVVSDKTKQLISEKVKGVPKSEEHKKALKEAQRLRHAETRRKLEKLKQLESILGETK